MEEGLGDMGLIGQSFNIDALERDKDDEYEGKSGSDNLEVASADDQETPKNKSQKRKKYHRHTPYQIQELEASFKENPHPDEKQRLVLGKKLNLESKQVKFWFQNKRTQMKNQLERDENLLMKQENENLRIENNNLKEAMRNLICTSCGGPATLGNICVDEHHLKFENARLHDDLNRLQVLTNKFLGRPLSPLDGPFPPPPVMSSSNLELAVGKSGFGGLGSVDAALPMGFDFVSNGGPSSRPLIDMTGVDIPKSMFLDLAMAAMDELVKVAQGDTPLWLRSLDGSSETLNFEEYTGRTDMKPRGFITKGTRASGIVKISSLFLVELLMDANQWPEMFPGMVGSSTMFDVIACGMGGTKNGALQMMHGEIQVISPFVPVRQVRFLRFCKQHGDGVWAMVDVSIDGIREAHSAHTSVLCRRLLSGCIMQDMPDGYSKVTWVEHSEYDESEIHHLYLPFVRSGMGFGAQRWLTTLQRQCDFFAAIRPSTTTGEDHSGITPNGRRNIAKLAQRMTREFCAGVCATGHKWEVVQVGNMGENAKLMIRKIGHDDPGELAGVVLSAAVSVLMPVQHRQLFDVLQNEQLRSQWDFLFNCGPMQEMVNIAKGQHGNNISILRAGREGANNSNKNNRLILQEKSTDTLGSLIVMAAVDVSSMEMVMGDGDSAHVAILPSGYAIVPACFPNSGGGPDICNRGLKAANEGSGGGSLLTVGIQLLLNDLPTNNPTVESVGNMNSLISRTIQGIKEALQCS